MIIPSIDLMDGKAVQLRQGREKVLEKENVLELAKEFSRVGEIAVIDLDAALGKGDNTELIMQICKIADCRVGGGIRTVEKAYKMLKAGAKKIIIGTKAKPEFLKQLPNEKVIVAVDTKNRFVVDKGWTRSTAKRAEDLIKELECYCSEFLFTNVDKEGLLKGCDLEKIRSIRKLTKNKITVAGGISTIDEIKQIEQLDYNSQLGMALYTGKISLSDAFIATLNLDQLIPTIVQDDKGQVLMLAYSSKESIKKTIETAKSWFYSRSRKKLWMKGEESGNTQSIIKIYSDCDNDTLLYKVKQKNFACHKGGYSCFGEEEFNLGRLFSIIEDRKQNPKKNSYTNSLLEDDNLLKKKLNEEMFELIAAKTDRNKIWEAADVLYFLTVYMTKNNICLKDVLRELGTRHK